jgi:hypothetical protein
MAHRSLSFFLPFGTRLRRPSFGGYPQLKQKVGGSQWLIPIRKRATLSPPMKPTS